MIIFILQPVDPLLLGGGPVTFLFARLEKRGNLIKSLLFGGGHKDLRGKYLLFGGGPPYLVIKSRLFDEEPANWDTNPFFLTEAPDLRAKSLLFDGGTPKLGQNCQN